MTKPMRIWLLPFPLLLALALSSSEKGTRSILGDHAEMAATRVAIDPRDPARTQVGKLSFLGGLRLTSPDPAFGGFSSLTVEGDRFTLLSDNGNIVRFRMGADWRPRELSFGDLPGGPGTGRLKEDRDSEAMTIDGAGHRWVAFENDGGIYRYDGAFTRAERHAFPKTMRKWRQDYGPESLVRLSDGRFIVLCEGRVDRRPNRPALLFAGDPTEAPDKVTKFTYLPPDGYSPSDAAQLPDGRLVVINRRFSAPPTLFSVKLTIVDPRAIREGAIVKGTEIAALERPLLHDNYEAVAVTREGGATILWIASDDNAQFWEWSLLLKFRLDA
ncbi:esterase-like activity of phytase family protein [Sphingomonas sp. MMS12-HWE2-04]|uniref:esterase-like activity of phytase family protein n=1 Tax=Sphingomonas sp. MMS12-HWE2-04 TaxID=3234199 RepID=UPI00384F07A2